LFGINAPQVWVKHIAIAISTCLSQLSNQAKSAASQFFILISPK